MSLLLLTHGKGISTPFPPPPTRGHIGLPTLHFGGLTFTHSLYGAMPLFEACVAWLSPDDRRALYATKHAAGDTHLLIEVPNGVPLYDEPNQPYSPDRFGPLDALAGYTQVQGWFLDLLAEVIHQGFTPVLFMNEEMTISFAMMRLLLPALRAYPTADLTQYVLLSPGWDGVFYGWTDPDGVPRWAREARALVPTCYLFLEHDPGHIPLGEGGGDYLPGGAMAEYDIVAGEFVPWLVYGNPPGDTVWQICARMACPTGYLRPPDQPVGDDPNPPNYLAGKVSPRGRWFYWVFETGEYEWNLGRMTVPQFTQQRAYYRSLGCETVC